jgi:hypothetical protein
VSNRRYETARQLGQKKRSIKPSQCAAPKEASQVNEFDSPDLISVS